MDKRLIWFALVVIMVVAAIFIFRNGCSKPVAAPATPGLVITPEIKITPTRPGYRKEIVFITKILQQELPHGIGILTMGATSTQQRIRHTLYPQRGLP